MKRTVLIFGLMLGVLLCINLVYVVYLCYTKEDLNSNDILGYAVMIVIFSLVYFGVRNYRNQQLKGVISFGNALKTGALIALTAATLYVIFWLFYYYLFVPDFLDQYIPRVLNEAADSGATTAEIAAKTEEMENFRQMYKNPLFIVLITYFEILPVGLVVAFVSALVLKRRKDRQEAASQP